LNFCACTCILQESEQKTSDAQLRGQVEQLTQQAEEQKVIWDSFYKARFLIASLLQLEMANLAADNQKLSEKLRSQADNLQRTMRSADLKTRSLQQDLDLSRSELLALQTEFEGYKVCVSNKRD
jgi:type I site-specific restriction endonuclease